MQVCVRYHRLCFITTQGQQWHITPVTDTLYQLLWQCFQRAVASSKHVCKRQTSSALPEPYTSYPRSGSRVLCCLVEVVWGSTGLLCRRPQFTYSLSLTQTAHSFNMLCVLWSTAECFIINYNNPTIKLKGFLYIVSKNISITSKRAAVLSIKGEAFWINFRHFWPECPVKCLSEPLCMCWFCMWAYYQIKILLTFPSQGFSQTRGNCSVRGIKALPIKPVSALQSVCVSQHVFNEAPSLDFTVLLNQQTCGEVLDPSHHHPVCCSVWVSLCL